MLLSFVFIASLTPWPPPKSHYDVMILGTGLKESLLAGLLASHGKAVLQLAFRSQDYGSSSFNLNELVRLGEGVNACMPSESKVGHSDQYCVERAPKMLIASSEQLQLLAASGVWKHMNPPGFKRIHRSLMYRVRPDGMPDVHRVLANSEDVLKTRALTPLEKARVVQFFVWVDRYDELDTRTHHTGPLSKQTLDLRKASAAKLLAHWDLPKSAIAIIVRGMALWEVPRKHLKKSGSAIELVRKLKRYKDAYKTFPHMTSPYVYCPGFGDRLAAAAVKVLEGASGCCVVDVDCMDDITLEASSVADTAAARVCISKGDVRVLADAAVASPACLPNRVALRYEIVRLYAVVSPAAIERRAVNSHVCRPHALRSRRVLAPMHSWRTRRICARTRLRVSY